MDNIDKKNHLEEKPFSYRVSKNQTVFIDFVGNQIKVLKSKEAEKLLSKINSADSEKEIQLILAKITGNFKRGNERM